MQKSQCYVKRSVQQYGYIEASQPHYRRQQCDVYSDLARRAHFHLYSTAPHVTRIPRCDRGIHSLKLAALKLRTKDGTMFMFML